VKLRGVLILLFYAECETAQLACKLNSAINVVILVHKLLELCMNYSPPQITWKCNVKILINVNTVFSSVGRLIQ